MFNIDLDLIQHQDSLKISNQQGQSYIWDPIRKKKVRFTPEEHVRQLILQYLLKEINWSSQLIAIEKVFYFNKRKKRFDILLFKTVEEPFLLIECKSPNELITQAHFDQLGKYNYELNAPYVWLSNGRLNTIASIDGKQRSMQFLTDLDFLRNPNPEYLK